MSQKILISFIVVLLITIIGEVIYLSFLKPDAEPAVTANNQPTIVQPAKNQVCYDLEERQDSILNPVVVEELRQWEANSTIRSAKIHITFTGSITDISFTPETKEFSAEEFEDLNYNYDVYLQIQEEGGEAMDFYWPQSFVTASVTVLANGTKIPFEQLKRGDTISMVSEIDAMSSCANFSCIKGYTITVNNANNAT